MNNIYHTKSSYHFRSIVKLVRGPAVFIWWKRQFKGFDPFIAVYVSLGINTADSKHVVKVNLKPDIVASRCQRTPAIASVTLKPGKCGLVVTRCTHGTGGHVTIRDDVWVGHFQRVGGAIRGKSLRLKFNKGYKIYNVLAFYKLSCSYRRTLEKTQIFRETFNLSEKPQPFSPSEKYATFAKTCKATKKLRILHVNTQPLQKIFYPTKEIANIWKNVQSCRTISQP